MELTDAQKEAVTGWIDEGCGLSEVQRRLSDELKISMTYMDVRFLIIDMGLDLHEEDATPAEADAVPDGQPAGDVAEEPAASAPEATGPVPVPGEPGGAVSVEVDRLMKPGAIVSGTVTFSDGVTASWGLDQMGRLALDAGDPEYRPTEQDVQAFQDQIRQALEAKGF